MINLLPKKGVSRGRYRFQLDRRKEISSTSASAQMKHAMHRRPNVSSKTPRLPLPLCCILRETLDRTHSLAVTFQLTGLDIHTHVHTHLVSYRRLRYCTVINSLSHLFDSRRPPSASDNCSPRILKRLDRRGQYRLDGRHHEHRRHDSLIQVRAGQENWIASFNLQGSNLQTEPGATPRKVGQSREE